MIYSIFTQGPQDKLDRVEKPLQMINVSTLPLTVKLMLNYPFLLCLDNGDETEETIVFLQSNEALKVLFFLLTLTS